MNNQHKQQKKQKKQEQQKKQNIKLMPFVLVFIISAMFFSSSVLAQIQPLKLSTDRRIEVVAYSPNNVIPIHGTTFVTTQIIFGKNEQIYLAQTGDLGAWTTSYRENDSPNTLFIKPTIYNSHTNMTVITNKHTYYFQLTSNAQGQNSQKNVTYAIRFIYPNENKARFAKSRRERNLQASANLSKFKNPTAYNWNYSFSGDRRIMPIHIFDDGKFTYMELRSGQAVPAVFAVDNPNGQEAVVNYRQKGRYLIIERIAPQFTLRVGKNQVASIFNNKLINSKKKGHWF